MAFCKTQLDIWQGSKYANDNIKKNLKLDQNGNGSKHTRKNITLSTANLGHIYFDFLNQHYCLGNYKEQSFFDEKEHVCQFLKLLKN